MSKEEETVLDSAFAQFICPRAPLPTQQFFSRLMASSRKGHLCIRSSEPMAIEHSAIVRDRDRYYIQRNWALETILVEKILRLFKEIPEERFDLARLQLSPSLTPAQAEAIRHVSRHSLTVISGGPGTGKTFTAAQLIQSLMGALLPERGPLKVKVAAPTGKAADQLALGIASRPGLEIEAMTLHRLLGLRPGRERLFEPRAIEADLILVDEASMIDASLFAHLFSAIPIGARLVLLGDADQLPPINGGNLFSDLTQSYAIRLDRCYRAQEEGLYQLYEAARSGDLPPLLALLEPFPLDLFSWIESMGANRRLICPLRKGPFGVDAINRELLLRQERRLSLGERWSAPILITANDSQRKLYNGTTGILEGEYRGGKLPHGSEEARMADGRRFPLQELPGFEVAYALSTHKSQGSEFEQVLCLLPPGSEEFGREALYTALTRAKKTVRLVGTREVLEQMIAIKARQESGLQERLSERAKSF